MPRVPSDGFGWHCESTNGFRGVPMYADFLEMFAFTSGCLTEARIRVLVVILDDEAAGGIETAAASVLHEQCFRSMVRPC